MYPSNQHLHPVAGFSGGKKIYATQEAFAVLRELRIDAAQKQNFWATTVIRGIDSLTSGPMKKNVFINPKQIRGSDESFTVFFPGAAVQVTKNSRDEYCIVGIQQSGEVDGLGAYAELYRDGALPGMYSATKKDNDWFAKPKQGQQPSAKELVTIADRTYEDPAEAARYASDHLGGAKEVNLSDFRSSTGFNLHYTPSDKRIGKLQRYRRAKAPSKDVSIRQSAHELAQTMYNSQDVEGVRWVTEYGGSAIMTEALKQVGDWGGNLEKHTVFLQYPTTSQVDVARQADRVNLAYGRDLSKSGIFSYKPMDQRALAIYRKNSDSDSNSNITGLQSTLDAWKPVGATVGALGVLTSLAGLAGVSLGTAAISPAVVAIGGTIAKGVGALAAASKSTELLGRRGHHAVQRAL